MSGSLSFASMLPRFLLDPSSLLVWPRMISHGNTSMAICENKDWKIGNSRWTSVERILHTEHQADRPTLLERQMETGLMNLALETTFNKLSSTSSFLQVGRLFWYFFYLILHFSSDTL